MQKPLSIKDVYRKLPEITTYPGAQPTFEHDCEDCVFLGAVLIEGEYLDLYGHPPYNGHGSIIARYGSSGEQYMSDGFYDGAASSIAPWAQVAATLSDVAIEADRVDGVELLADLPVQFNKMRFGKPVTMLAGSKEYWAVKQAPKVGDLIWTNPGPQRTVGHVHGLYYKNTDGRHIYTIEDNNGRGHEVRRCLIDGTLYWCTGHHE